MAETSRITDALSKLDKANDNHWTSEGLPRIDTVKLLAGNQALTREEITKAAPEFTRDSAGPTAPQESQSQGSTDPAVVIAPAAVTNGAGTDEALPPDPQLDEVVGIDYDTAIALAREALEKAQAVLDEALAAHKVAQTLLDDKINAKHAAGAGETSMSAIQSYLAGQRRLLDEKADRMRTLNEAGMSVKGLRDLFPQAAPIDQSLAGRNRKSGK